MSEEMRAILERLVELERVVEGFKRKNAVASTGRSGTLLDVVLHVLSNAKEEWLTVNDIAERGTIDHASVRAVLYTHNGELFQKDEISPRRIRWKIRGPRSTRVQAVPDEIFEMAT